MSTASILTLKQITDQAVGGKAAGLAELTRMGLAVPPAFVIPAAKIDQFPEDLESHYHAIGGKVAVRGLGEALVSGEVTPYHYELAADNTVVCSELTGDEPILDHQAINALALDARSAAAKMNALLDMEWAIDQSGELFWLQARPITALVSDLNELDTPIPPDNVITRCNVGEMMPGAVCPLIFSVQGRAIEHGYRLDALFQPDWRFGSGCGVWGLPRCCYRPGVWLACHRKFTAGNQTV